MAIVLVVDDEKDVVEILISILEKEGHMGLEAFSGEEAIKILKKSEVDLILLDLMMPGMTGLEVCKELENDTKLSKIPVIVVTARGDLDSIEKSYKCGSVENYIAKPFDRNNLIKIVDDVLESKTIKAPRKKRKKSIKKNVYKEIFRNYPEGIAILDKENNILEINNSFETITGYTKKELIGRHDFPDLLKPQDDDGNLLLMAEAFKACFCEVPTSSGTFNIINKNGLKVKVVSTIFKPNPESTILILENISED